MRSFSPRSASLIMRASNPAPAITAKCSPLTVPVSIGRRCPCRPICTASARSFGIFRLVASRLAVPAGKIAMVADLPASASIHRCTVPSPPQTNTTSAPSLKARRANFGAFLLLGTSYHWGLGKPSRAKISRSSPNPPPRVLAECAITAMDVMCQGCAPQRFRRNSVPLARRRAVHLFRRRRDKLGWFGLPFESGKDPMPLSDLRSALHAAVDDGTRGVSAADRLCAVCVDLLEVDGAAISLVLTGAVQGTFGSSGDLSRKLDEFQFTFGEGPCLEAVSNSRAVLVPDLRDPSEQRWPAYAGAVLESGVRAVFALPVEVGSSAVGALDLFRSDAGPLTGNGLAGGLLAAKFASMPLLDLMSGNLDISNPSGESRGVDQLASLARVEVYQATGMLMGQLNIGSAEALMRLRAHAFAHGMTASAVAWAIIERQLELDADEPLPGPGSAPRHTS